MKCPFCGSPHATVHLPGRQAGERFGALLGAAVGAAYVMRGARVGVLIGAPAGPIGAIAGGFVGAVFAGMFTGSVASRIGRIVGGFADDNVALQCHCDNCNSTFPYPQADVERAPAAPAATAGTPMQEKPGGESPEGRSEVQPLGAS